MKKLLRLNFIGGYINARKCNIACTECGDRNYITKKDKKK